MDRIDRFNGRYWFLSNFSASPVKILAEEGGEVIVCPTVEHAFQALKTLDPDERVKVASARTPGEAKKIGRRVSLRENWDETRDEAMRLLLRQKFAAGTELADLLLATGGVELVEGNSWGDRYWGVCGGKGENRLGILLMERRAELYEE
jgi:ribA/ribD-fused uncharacterized protein